MALGDYKPIIPDISLDDDIGLPKLGGYIPTQAELGNLKSSLGVKKDSAIDFSIDQAQKLGYKGVETLGGLVGSDTIKGFGREQAEAQDVDIEEGGYKSQYHGSFTEQEGFGNTFGWIVEKSLENIAPTGASLLGAGAAALTAPFSIPAAAAIMGATAVGTGLLGAGEVLSEQEEKGVTPNYDVAAGTGALIGALDVFGAGKVIPVNLLRKMTGGQIVDKLVEEGHEEAAKGFARTILEKTASEALTEGVQEGLAMGSTNILGAQYETREVVDRIIDAAILGGTLGGAVGTADTYVRGKFDRASRNATPETEDTTPSGGTPETEEGLTRQLSLFGDEGLPVNARRDEEGKITVVNPVTSGELINKEMENSLKLIAQMEAAQQAEGGSATYNKGIRQVLNALDRKYGRLPKTTEGVEASPADIAKWKEAQDIISFYRDKLNKKKKATTAKAKREEAKKEIKPEVLAPEAEKVLTETKEQAPEERVSAIAAAAEKVQAKKEGIPEKEIEKVIEETTNEVKQSEVKNVQPDVPAEVETQDAAGETPSISQVRYTDSEPLSGVMHTLRNEEDLESILSNGLKSGTNVGSANSQAIGGGITLEYDPNDLVIEPKQYRPEEGVVDSNIGNPKPKRVLVDTSDLGLDPGKPGYEEIENEMGEFYKKNVQEEGGFSEEEFFSDVGGSLDEFASPSKRDMASFGKGIRDSFKKKYGSVITNKLKSVAKRWDTGLNNITEDGEPGEGIPGQTEEQYVQNIADQAEGIPVFTHQIDEDGKPINIQPHKAVVKEGTPISFNDWMLENRGIPAISWEALSQEDKATIGNDYRIYLEGFGEAGKLQPTSEKGMRDMNTVGVIKAKGDTAPVKQNKPGKEYEEVEYTFDDRPAEIHGTKPASGKPTRPYKSANSAARGLKGRKNLRNTHKVMKLPGKEGYVLAPKSEAEVRKAAEEAKAAVQDKRKATLSSEFVGDIAEPVELSIEDDEFGPTEEQSVELEQEWGRFALEKHTSDHVKKWNGIIEQVLAEQEVENIRDIDWNQPNGRELYQIMVNSIKGRKLDASVLRKNKANEELIASARQSGMGDITARLPETVEPITEEVAAVSIQQVPSTPIIEPEMVIEDTPDTPLEKRTVKQLKDMAQGLKITGRSKLKTKAKLIKAIKEATEEQSENEVVDLGNVIAPSVGVEDTEEAGQDIVDRDLQVLEDEAKRIANAKPEEVKNEVIDTRAIDLKKRQVQIREQLKEFEDQGYDMEMDGEVIALKEERASNTRQLYELGAIKAPPKKKGALDSLLEEPDEKSLDLNNPQESYEDVLDIANSSKWADLAEPSIHNKDFPVVKNTPLKIAELKRVFNEFVGRANISDIDLHFVTNREDIPYHLRKTIDAKYPRGSGRFPRGLHFRAWKGRKPQVIVFADRVGSSEQLIKTLLHEIVGHHGMRSLFGNDWVDFMEKSLTNTPDLFQKAYERLAVGGENPYKFNFTPKGKSRIARMMTPPTMNVRLNGRDVRVDKGEAVRLLDEYLAKLAESFTNPSIVDYHKSHKAWFMRVKAWIKHKMRSFGIGTKFQYKLTDQDIMGLLSEYYARAFPESGIETVEGYNPQKMEELNNTINSPLYISTADQSDLVFGTEEEFINSINTDLSADLAFEQDIPIENIKGTHSDGKQQWSELNRHFFGKRHQQFVDAFHKKFPKLTQFLNPNENLNNANAKRVIMNEALGKITRVTHRSAIAAKMFSKFSDIQKQRAHEYFTTARADIQNYPEFNKEQKKTIASYKNDITEMGQKLVDLGLLPQEIYEKNKGAYLHVNYLKYLSNYRGAGKRTSIMSYLEKKDPLLSREEKTRLGNLEKNVEWVVPDMLFTIGRDIALLEYTDQIVKMSNDDPTKQWVLPNSEIKMPDGRSYRMFQLDTLVKEWGDIISRGPSASINRVDIEKLQQDLAIGKQLLAAKEAELQIQVEEDPGLNAKYKRLPKQKEYGKLAGEYVARGIYDELTDNAIGYNPGANTLLEKFFDPNSLTSKAHQWWKIAKVPLNPPSWVRNGIGNLVLLDISSGTNIVKLTDYVIDALTGISTNNHDVFITKAIDKGMFGTTFSTQEIHILKDKFERSRAKLIKNQGGNNPNSALEQWHRIKTMMEGIVEMSSDFYGVLEGSFKTAKIRDHITTWEKQNGQKYTDLTAEQQNILFDEAALQGNQAIFDYSDVPQWLRMGRRSIIGAPFLTYTYKALPAVIRGFSNHPQKFIKYMMLPYTLAALATSVGDLDEDDLDDFERKGPRWMAEKTSVYVLPWKDDNNNLQAMDFGYYFPWAPWMDMYKSTNVNWKGEEPVISTVNSVGRAATSLGFLGGPLPSMITGAFTNTDQFTGRTISEPGQTGGERVANTMSWLWTMWTPSMLGSTGVFSKLADRYDIHPISALTGLPTNDNSLNQYGEERSTAGQDIIRGAGVNIYSIDPDTTDINNLRGFNTEQNDIVKAKFRMMSNHNIPVQEKVKRLKEYNIRLISLNKRREKYFKQGI